MTTEREPNTAREELAPIPGVDAILFDIGGTLVDEAAPATAVADLVPEPRPGVAACLRSIDKVMTKHLLRERGIPTPDWVAFNSTAFRELGAADALAEIEATLGFPLVVKPAAQGSSLGVRFAADREQVPEALVAAFSYDDRVLLERHVDGRELAVSLIDGEALSIV